MSDLSTVADTVRRIAHYVGDLNELADALDAVAKLDSTKTAFAAEIGDLTKDRDKLKADVAKLKKDADRHFHEVASIVPESEAQAKTILEAASSKAAELEKEARDKANRIIADANEYSKSVRERVTKALDLGAVK
jgi:cell division septum initiation protein DivIVA